MRVHSPTPRTLSPFEGLACDQPTRKVHVTGHAVPVADTAMGGPMWAVG